MVLVILVYRELLALKAIQGHRGLLALREQLVLMELRELRALKVSDPRVQ